ncbi:uncharacterized protein LOC144166388 [Haemaphysalis longicornis]
MSPMRISGYFVLCAAFAHAALQNNTTPSGEPCDFSGIDAENIVREVLDRFPVEYDPELNREPGIVVAGVSFYDPIYTGLDKLEPNGPVKGYCRNGTRLVHVELATSGGSMLKVFIPWSTCSSDRGILQFSARVRFTLTFQVITDSDTRPSPSTGAKLRLRNGPVPLSVDPVDVLLQDAGEVPRALVLYLAKLFPQLPHQYWMHIFNYGLRDAIKNSIESLPA